jgi:TrmH family RNA methyltransferase
MDRSRLITSLQNPRVKELVRLRTRRGRREQGVVPVEEPLVVRRALQAGCRLRAIYHCPELLGEEQAAELLAELTAASDPTVATAELTARVMNRVSYRQRPTGLLALVTPVPHRLAELEMPADPLLLVVDRLEKPGNLGALLRAADGAGAQAVLVTAPGPDLLNPNVVRASRGALFALPVVVAPAGEIRRFLAERGIRVLAATPDARLVYTAADLRGPLAIVVGAEDRGLDRQWLEGADLRAAIPMQGSGDSLNVAVAAALVLYEALRQRRPGGDVTDVERP